MSDNKLTEVEESVKELDSSECSESEESEKEQLDKSEEVTDHCNKATYRDFGEDESDSKQSLTNESIDDINNILYQENEEHFIEDLEDITNDNVAVSNQQSRSESVSSNSNDSVHNLLPTTTSSEETCSKDNYIVPVTSEMEASSQDPQKNLQSGSFGNIKIQTITVNEDDDLFDFEHTETSAIDGSKEFEVLEEIANKMTEGSFTNLNNSTDKEEEHLEEGEVGKDLQKLELYKYLTAPNIDEVRSSEVTPQQSDHDSNEESDSGSESGDSDSGSYTTATSEEDDKQESVQEQPCETELPEVELPETNVVEKPKPTPVVRKTFRPRLTKKMKTRIAKNNERMKKSKEVTDKWLKELELPKNLDLSNPVQLNIADLNQYLTCGLCSGYLYEASTVTECMHTFCKTCIVRHCMEVSLSCPVCNILIHPTDPFVNIRLDRMIQDIVYKLLPNVAEAEMKNIREFYAAHPEVEPKEMPYYPGRPKISPAKTEAKTEEFTDAVPLVSLVLESESESPKEKEQLEKKFVRVRGSATIASVCRFLKKKLSLEDSIDIDIFCCGDIIEESSSTLQNIKEKFFSNDEDCLMLLQFRVGDS